MRLLNTQSSARASLAGSRTDHYLAEYLPLFDHFESAPRVLERQHLVDDRFDLSLLDQIHQRAQVFVVETVGADNLQLEAPDITQVFLRIEAGGCAANQDPAAALDAFERRHPGIAAGEIDRHVDAAGVGAALRLAELLDRPFR